LDEGDNDLIHFLAYFVAAIQTIESGIGQGAKAANQSTEEINIEVVLINLLNEIAEIFEI